MKKIIISLFLACTILSCSTDLDQEPLIQVTTENVSDIERSVFGAYLNIANAINVEFNFGEIRSDNTTGGGEAPFSDFDLFNSFLVTSAPIQTYWDSHYFSIINCNIAINNAEGDSSEETAELAAEAKFIRAYSYYNLVRTYGDVPINLASTVDPDDTEVLSRKPAAQVYDQIISDLNDAIMDLPSSREESSRPTLYTAEALLAKVYMEQGNTVAAEPLLEDVIMNSGATLLSDYADIWGEDNELNDEVLFAIQFEPNIGVANVFVANFSLSGTDNANYGTDDLVNAYEAGDLRLDLSIDTAQSNSPKKYIPTDPEQVNDSGIDWIVIRLADIILLYAEALNENGSDPATVLALLDDIRTRAGLAELDPNTINTQALVLEAIKQERRVELAFENQRWYDLVRWGDAQDEVGFDNADFLVFPIPASEVNATNGSISQNDGY